MQKALLGICAVLTIALVISFWMISDLRWKVELLEMTSDKNETWILENGSELIDLSEWAHGITDTVNGVIDSHNELVNAINSK